MKLSAPSSVSFSARVALLTLSLALPISLTNAGGGGANNSARPTAASVSAARSARMVVTIKWPTPTESRLIPVASNSVRITITNASGFSTSQVIASPTTRATFSNLPPSALTVTAAAYPDHDGNAQPAQATGTQIVTAVADDTFDLSLTLASTIDHLLLTQSAPSVAVGQTTTFAVAAQDAAGNIVLTGDTTWQWRSSNTAIASVTSDAASVTVSARAAGNTNISVMETESGKTISVPFTATAAVPASPTPAPTPATQQAVAYHIGPTHTGNTSFGKSLTFPANPTWSVTLDGPVSYPLIAGGKVFVATGGQGAKIYALDSSTGKVAWGPINTGGAYPWAGIAYDNGKVFAVNSDSLLQAFNPSGWIPRGLPRV